MYVYHIPYTLYIQQFYYVLFIHNKIVENKNITYKSYGTKLRLMFSKKWFLLTFENKGCLINELADINILNNAYLLF